MKYETGYQNDWNQRLLTIYLFEGSSNNGHSN